MSTEPITPDEARWILGFYHLDGGIQPGGFNTRLIEAITVADPRNRARLRLGFPGLVAAFEMQMDIDALQAIARSNKP
jgi:hypothetical protein